MNHFYNILFHLAHLIVIFFNLFGWIFKSTRKANLIVLSITFFSWFGLGIYYGWGYCPLTHMHWNLKRSMGETDLPNSYIKLLLDNVTQINWNAGIVDIITMSSFFMALGISIWLNFKFLFLKFKKKNR